MNLTNEINNDKSYYELLGVSPQCSQNSLKIAYKKKLFSCHPDKTPKKNGKDEIEKIIEAYSELKNSKKKSILGQIRRGERVISEESLEVFNLDDFDLGENEEGFFWQKKCDKCHFVNGVTIKEKELIETKIEDGEGGYEIIAECTGCSVCILIKFYDTQSS